MQVIFHVLKITGIDKVDIPQSNSMVEAVNKQLKQYYLYHQSIRSMGHGEVIIAEAIADDNNKPHGALFGLTPQEVWQGQIPDKHYYDPQKLLARKKRLEIIRNTKCCLKV